MQKVSFFSLELHWLHVSSSKGGLTPCHNSSLSYFYPGRVGRTVRAPCIFLIWIIYVT